jgi:hypothetical protein
MVNIIGGVSLAAAVGAEKGLEPKKNPLLDDHADVERNASVAAHMALPGFNPAAAPVDASSDVASADAVQPAQAVDKEQAVDAMKTAIQQFDDGLKKLANRPETQIAQALGFSHEEVDPNLPKPDPIPGVTETGLLELSKDDQAADVNRDGKVSEEERRRYEMPLTYRSVEHEHQAEAMADGPSAFSLAEANRAYGAATPPQPAS